MLVGYMDTNSTPAPLVNIIAVIAKAKGINIIYFKAEDVDLKTNRITGLMLIDDNWEESETEIPGIIDIEGFAAEYQPIIDDLEKISYVISNGNLLLASKAFFMKLIKEEEIKQFITPSDDAILSMS